MFRTLKSWLQPARTARAAPNARLRLEAMEARDVPAVFIVTNLNDAGAGSLRNAVDRANANHLDADVIQFQSGLQGTIALQTGQLEIQSPLRVVGPGADKLTVSGNQASRVFQAIGYQDGMEVTISDLTLADGNAAGDNGGALKTLNADVTLNRCVIRDNTAGYGGGVSAVEEGAVTVLNSTIMGNTALLGGGVYVGDGRLVVRNSTVGGNRATDSGGGVYVDGYGEARLVNSTVADNHAAGQGGGVFVLDQHVGPFHLLGSCSAASTLIADNTADAGGADVSGPLLARYSLIENAAGAVLRPASESNVLGQDPRLGRLAARGGSTPTYALLAGSPAIDAGSNPAGLATDQRGAARVQGGGTDIGAYER